LLVPGVRVGVVSFTPSRWPTAGAVVLIALTLYLGIWQTHRGDEKEERQRLLDSRIRETPVVLTGSVARAEPLVYRRARAAGEYDAAGQLFIDNQVREGRAGYHVVTPLRLRDGAILLVNRGWIARGDAYPEPPRVAVPAGAVEISGVATLPSSRFYELSSQTVSGPVWQNLTIERYSATVRGPVLPVVLLADVADPQLVALRETPDSGVAKHREYALTWFSLAATTLVLWIVLNVKRTR
jgi:surfeit locus 1 family protein